MRCETRHLGVHFSYFFGCPKVLMLCTFRNHITQTNLRPARNTNQSVNHFQTSTSGSLPSFIPSSSISFRSRVKDTKREIPLALSGEQKRTRSRDEEISGDRETKRERYTVSHLRNMQVNINRKLNGEAQGYMTRSYHKEPLWQINQAEHDIMAC